MNILSTLRRWRAQLYLAAGKLPPGWRSGTEEFERWCGPFYDHKSGWTVRVSTECAVTSCRGMPIAPAWEVLEPRVEGEYRAAVAHRATDHAAIVFVEGVR